MGYEAPCTARFEGRSAEGKASLETSDLVFRGPFRVVVPLKDVTAANVARGWLTLTYGPHTVALKLEQAAQKWADRILHPPSRLQKLGVKPGMVVVVIGVDDRAFLAEIGGEGATIAARAPARTADILFYAADSREALGRLRTLSARIKPNGALWVIRPKGHPAISESDVMAAGKRAGLVDVKVVSFSATHTAEKFVIPVARRPG
jgi:hypothetical protein